MINLEDRLRDLARDAIQANADAYSQFKDPDDSESYLDDWINTLIFETKEDIKSDLERYLGE